MQTKNSKQSVQNVKNNPQNAENCVNDADNSIKKPKSRQQVADEAMEDATTKG